mmetsp:Transcript_65370/g.147484  ORF Transcript_65370/g.147484 Transcript_65370/m.147484 type:complete len:249 (+) Transcript_65370:1-747(+)
MKRAPGSKSTGESVGSRAPKSSTETRAPPRTAAASTGKGGTSASASASAAASRASLASAGSAAAAGSWLGFLAAFPLPHHLRFLNQALQRFLSPSSFSFLLASASKRCLSRRVFSLASERTDLARCRNMLAVTSRDMGSASWAAAELGGAPHKSAHESGRKFGSFEAAFKETSATWLETEAGSIVPASPLSSYDASVIFSNESASNSLSSKSTSSSSKSSAATSAYGSSKSSASSSSSKLSVRLAISE